MKITILLLLFISSELFTSATCQKTLKFKIEVSTYSGPNLGKPFNSGSHSILLKKVESDNDALRGNNTGSVFRNRSLDIFNNLDRIPQITERNKSMKTHPRIYFENYQRKEYRLVAKIGSNKLPFRLLLDIRSPGIMLFEKFSPRSSHRKLFSCSKSTTCKVQNNSFPYNNNSRAVLVQDHAEFDNFQIRNMEFLLFNESVYFPTVFNRTDGYFGIGRFDEKNNTKLNLATFFYTNKYISRHMFSFYLGNSSNSFHDDAEITFGSINENLINESSIRYINFSSHQSHNDYVIDTDLISLLTPENFTEVISDTTQHIVLDTKEINIKLRRNIFDKFLITLKSLKLNCVQRNNGEKLIIRCIIRNNIQIGLNFPNITFHFPSGESIVIPPYSYFRECRYMMSFGESSKMDCLLGIELTDQPFLVLGQQFFRNYYTVFDIEAGKLGFGKVTGMFQAPKNRQPGYWYYTPMTLIMLWGVGMICCSVYFKKHLDRLNKLVYKVTLYIFCRRQIEPEDLDEDYSEQVDEVEPNDQVQELVPNSNRSQELPPPNNQQPNGQPSNNQSSNNSAPLIVINQEEEKRNDSPRNLAQNESQPINVAEEVLVRKPIDEIEKEEEEEKNQNFKNNNTNIVITHVEQEPSYLSEIALMDAKEGNFSRKSSEANQRGGLLQQNYSDQQNLSERENEKNNPSLSIIDFGDSDEEKQQK